MAGLKVITPPASEPVTLKEIRAQLRIELNDDSYDDILNPLITAAREWCEGHQNRAYMPRTLELGLDSWPVADSIDLLRPPLLSVTSVDYVGANGNLITWDPTNYVVDDYSFVPRLVACATWPSIRRQPNAIKVRYIAGYDDVNKVPERVKQAIILLVNTWFDTPGAEPPDAVKNLLSQDRVVPV